MTVLSLPCVNIAACRQTWLICALCLIMTLFLWGCGSKAPEYKGGIRGTTKPYTVRGVTYYPLASAKGFDQTGVASWYGPSFHGRMTSSGERYNQNTLTAAHTILPFQSEVEVTNLSNGKSVVVRINDRGPFVKKRVIDLSKAAASRIGVIGPGTARVRIRALDHDEPAHTPDAGTGVYAGLNAQDTAQAASGSRTDTASGANGGTYYIQIGAFKSFTNASSVKTKARRKGYPVQTVTSDSGLIRVLLGPWNSLDEVNTTLWSVDDDFPGAYLVDD